ncbi:Para-nitrobenzyl esterase [Cyphellophora attinorum]|uniref:Carboxylic ester hydrolase n=1 Tax=Cyphellophora attinorum TaxID=1664694 RepID=A0A0N1P2Y9_9EURO|nr:Para-nitrobenzyl esterase [Phialophora attinorum]KPI44480.1 Para-nitrobenzyl esterase [Phialophora attinorum]
MRWTAIACLGLTLGVVLAQDYSSSDDLLVKTGSLVLQGTLEENMPNVRVFRGVPFAEPPLGQYRFRPPVTKKSSSEVINATWFGPSCIQLDNGQKTVYTEHLQGFLLTPGQQDTEDCLTLNIWTPRGAEGQKFPVILYIPGGGYTGGGGASPYKYGGPMVRDQQDVIVVTMNYRLNIFGFPNAAGLDQHNLNLGLLDQRKAVEWAFNNVAAFGGDPSRMILWGQSAGAGSADSYAYAWPDDPVVYGFAIDSGSGDGAGRSASDTSNFTYVAQQVGCTQEDKYDQFACMQTAPAEDIIGVLSSYNASDNDGLSLGFGPTTDDETKFSNYSDLQARGRFAKVPLLAGNTNDEGQTLSAPYNEDGSAPNQTLVEIGTNRTACGIGRAAEVRAEHDVPVWRWRYLGYFPNLQPLEWLRSYHSSELPLVFGTSDFSGPDTEVEDETSKYMQGAWVAFAKDPVNGLSRYGWPTYDAAENTLVELALDGNTSAVFAAGIKYDSTCQSSD